jgi:hypothetical protein
MALDVRAGIGGCASINQSGCNSPLLVKKFVCPLRVCMCIITLSNLRVIMRINDAGIGRKPPSLEMTTSCLQYLRINISVQRISQTIT